LAAVDRDVASKLLPGEKVRFVTQQSRVAPGGSFTTPDKIYVTDKRVIFRNPSMLGLKKEFVMIDFQLVAEARINKGVFSSEVLLRTRMDALGKELIRLPAIAHQDAEQVMKLVQEGIGRAAQPTSKEDPIERLRKLDELRKSGGISEEEYAKLKAKIMEQL
jgi:hypothetical protein